MKTPFDIITGRIVGYDDKRGELLIRAPYDDHVTLTRREYKTCSIQLNDGRKLSDKQRRTCYMILRDIGSFTGMGTDPTKEYLKLKFLADEFGETAEKIFSLSNAPMSLVAAFQRFLIRFVLDWDIPTSFPLYAFADDLSDYLYACLINRKCAVCGRRADLHHVDHVGIGRDRDEIIHEGMEVMPLCREHHNEAHSTGQQSFNSKYHIDKGVILDKTLCKIYGLKGDKTNVKRSSNSRQIDGESRAPLDTGGTARS